MAAIAHLVEGKHTDQPSCVSPVLRAFTIPANDAMDDKTRQRFLPYLHRLAGSVDQDNEQKRCRIIVLAALRVFAPMALDSAGMHAQAENLRELPDDIDMAVAAGGAKAAAGAAESAKTAGAAGVWNAYFEVLDQALSAGKQGDPWSADAVEFADRRYSEIVSVP
jgi:hypothetical protein